MTRRGMTLAASGVLAAVLAIVGLAMPVPYVLLKPGPTFNTLGEFGNKPLIGISGHAQYPTGGHLDLTTVSVIGGQDNRVSLFDALRGWLDDTTAVVPEELIFPPDTKPDEVQQQNADDMRESQDHARVAALRYLNIPVTTELVVSSTAAGSPADNVGLTRGDVITQVDGETVTSAQQLRGLIGRHKVGEAVSVTFVRNGRTATVKPITIQSTDKPLRPIIGVTPAERPNLPFEVTIGLKDVGGPSAGLMFALGIVDKLTPDELTNGQYVAGTGTIDDDGTVGPIGGIQQKIAAARAKGATVFMTPAADCAEAAAARPNGLKLVRVSTLTEAVASLQKLASHQKVTECTAS
ncbi:MAG: Lon-like protease [Frankiaceae bacterium]|jgi:PDZ domain-containing protein|nr:Lon-like protease [Frankiaceae bacterium]